MHMNKKTILWTISLIILGIATVYGTLYYLQWRDKELWEKQKQKEQGEIKERELTQEEIELNNLRQEAEKRLNPETGELIQTETKEQSKKLESTRIEAEKRLEPKKATTIDQQTQEQALDQRREEAMKRLLNQ